MFWREKPNGVPVEERGRTFLAQGVRLKGVLTYEGTVRVDGEFQGEIISQGTLIVGEQGMVDAEITAGTVLVGGKVSGNIHAHHKIHLLSKSVVTGTLTAPIILMEEGALLNGLCEMKRLVEPMFQLECRGVDPHV